MEPIILQLTINEALRLEDLLDEAVGPPSASRISEIPQPLRDVLEKLSTSIQDQWEYK